MSTQLSRFLSLVLRHDPARVGIELDPHGWVDVAALIDACAAHGVRFSHDELTRLVATSDKQRFALSDDGARIRANQGHTVKVDLALTPAIPPAVLYHGTATRFLDGIRAHGLLRGKRHHVHLSADARTASQVGARHGKLIVLTIRAAEMAATGRSFFLSANGVWLTAEVPVQFIDMPALPRNPHAAGTASRGDKVQIARTTLRACDAGHYTNAAGERVELGSAVRAAVAGTVTYETDADLAQHEPNLASHGARTTTAVEATGASTSASLASHGARTTPTAFEVTGESTIQALIRLAREPGHLGCLNFASAKNPGGGFLGGAQAQEEALARSSALYPCLMTQEVHYEANRRNHSLLYLDRVIWSPRVPFFRDDDGGWLAAPVLASVLTCAAPNAGALDRGTPVAELEATLARRARLVLSVARHHAIDTLVLGAWGCGVFRNDPVMVARTFHALLHGEFAGAFRRVVFAVLGTPEISANHRAFADAFRSDLGPAAPG